MRDAADDAGEQSPIIFERGFVRIIPGSTRALACGRRRPVVSRTRATARLKSRAMARSVRLTRRQPPQPRAAVLSDTNVSAVIGPKRSEFTAQTGRAPIVKIVAHDAADAGRVAP
ncbi:MAG: hypothetical protein WDN00_15955 [Limisphaerales bacterium]